MEPEPREPAQILSRTMGIVLLAMAIVMVCVSVVAVIVTVNERTTQRVADAALEQNQELQDELRCLRPAALDFDKAAAQIQIDIARGLAAISSGAPVPEDLGSNLGKDADGVEKALAAREASVEECRK